MFRLLWLSVLIATVSGHHKECSGAPSPTAQPNLLPIWTQPPVFEREVPNGKLFTVGNGEDSVPLLHLWGSGYDRGFAQGSLLGPQIKQFTQQVWTYMEQQVDEALKSGTSKFPFPPSVLHWIANKGLDVVLDLTYDATVLFTNSEYYDELKGMAEASGADYLLLRRIHMIGEVTKAACSMFGAWGSATSTGQLLQLRALDWDIDGPFVDFPLITIYHGDGSSKQGMSFANVGWVSWVGVLTGMSSRLGVSEIGVTYPDDTFGSESRIGVPFNFLLRDILQFEHSLSDSLDHIAHAARTCNLILGVGDGTSHEFRGIQYSHSVANFISPSNLRPESSVWHPKIEDTVYWGMDWLCPGYSRVLAEQLKKFHGSLTAEAALRNVTAIVQTGDLHVALYDYGRSFMFVSTARGSKESGPRKAFDRTFLRLDMEQVFNEPPPDMSFDL